MKKIITAFLLTFLSINCFATYILIPMDETQQNHLKAYGVAFFTLQNEKEVSWLLNYKGGSFLIKYDENIEKNCKLKGVTYSNIADVQAMEIINFISNDEVNMEVVLLHKAPKIAVYSPKNKLPWDDAVTLVLTYAEIPYDVVYDEDVINGVLPLYDWLHLHHEDFTGQYGKFYGNYRNQKWYKEDVALNEERAKRLGFNKVSKMKLFVAKKIKEFVSGGGFMFAMCSAPDSFDIALAAENTDICDAVFDYDPIDPLCQQKLDYSKCFAFKDFVVETNPYKYSLSNIDTKDGRGSVNEKNDLFVLFDFSAKWDWIPTMLTQNHTKIIKGFMGQSTAFNKKLLKTNVVILGENKSIDEVRYIHGEFQKGTWTFLGGHDPEDYQHFVGDPPTDLSLFPSSAGYRLILNNILFPAAKKEKHKT
ncbi:MAG: asparagine synthetase B [Bacteroidales bacterium]|jgi:hypothetical protein|nr:asparagine synthetase B [Bacteroidales bacterium]